MTTHLATTFDVLTKSRNEAASAVLSTILKRENSPLYSSAIQSALLRRNKSIHLQILSNWHMLSQADKELVVAGRGRTSAALRDAVLAKDAQLFANACELVELTDEFDIVPTLVTLAEHRDNPHAGKASDLVLKLAERLSEWLLTANKTRQYRDPRTLRKHVLDSLQRSLVRYRYHKLDAVVEAFLLLTESTDELLLSILDDPHHPCFQTLTHVLTKSTHPGIFQLLFSLLSTEKPPATLFSVISHRDDKPFITELFAFCEKSKDSTVSVNLKRIRTFTWLNSSGFRLSHLEELEQVRAVRTITATGLPQEVLSNALEELLVTGKPAGRAAACAAMAPITGEHANRLILMATKDPVPEVQAEAIRQLRNRHIPGTMPLLESMLDSPIELLRQAAQAALAEFNFENYIQNFDQLNDETRLKMGQLTRRVDLEFHSRLRDELTAPVVKRRLRGIAIAQQLEMLPEIIDELLQLTTDSEYMVRASVAEVLQHCPTPTVLEALEDLVHDRSGTVQNAARRSLAALAALDSPATPGTTGVSQ